MCKKKAIIVNESKKNKKRIGRNRNIIPKMRHAPLREMSLFEDLIFTSRTISDAVAR